MNVIEERLNKILPKITSDDFLSGSGIGNEIAFYIFDYPPEAELRVREHIHHLLHHIPKRRPTLKVKHINLFDLVVGHLNSRGILDRSFIMQKEKGDDALLKAIQAPLHESKIAAIFAETAKPNEHDLVLVSGVGSVFPMMRTHTLLNNLHPLIGLTPLVLFYPGRYDGQSLRLFGKLQSNNYYRAFRLIT